MAMSDMPGDEPLPEGADNLVMNAALKFGDHLLMASDVFDIDDFGAMQYMYVNFTTTDPRPGPPRLEVPTNGAMRSRSAWGRSPRWGDGRPPSRVMVNANVPGGRPSRNRVRMR